MARASAALRRYSRGVKTAAVFLVGLLSLHVHAAAPVELRISVPALDARIAGPIAGPVSGVAPAAVPAALPVPPSPAVPIATTRSAAVPPPRPHSGARALPPAASGNGAVFDGSIDRAELEKTFSDARPKGAPTNVRWSPDSAHVTYLQKGRLKAYSWDRKTTRTWIKKVEQGFYRWSPKGDSVLYVSGGRLRLFDVARRRSRVIAPYKDMGNVELSPDGRFLSFVRDGDVWIQLVEGGLARRLTGFKDRGAAAKLQGYEWSPDSTRVASLAMDYSDVPAFPLADYSSRYGEVENKSYPMPGAPLPKPLVEVTALDGRSRVVPLARDAAYLENVLWTSRGELAVMTRNRAQTRRTVRVERRTVLTEKDRVWVVDDRTLLFLADGRPVSLSEKSGHRHIVIDGRPVTRGDWNVQSIDAVDEKNGWILYTSNEGSPIESHIWRVSLDGKWRECLSDAPGSHQAIVSPDGSRFIDVYSSVEHSTVMEPIQPAPLARRKDDAVVPEFFEIPAEDGTPMDAMLLRPKGLPKNARVPVIVYLYGGANRPEVTNGWDTLTAPWHQFMVRRGFATMVVDNRLSGLRSAKTVRKMHNRLGELETRDLASAARWLKKQPWVDAKRIGVWGWSFGGYMTTMAMTRLKDFAAGVAVAPVTDWTLYNAGYTERRLGTPQKNPGGYKRSSPLTYAADLSGELMIVHGLHDDNVHFQHAERLITALDDAGKSWDLRAYPGQSHDIGRGPDRMNLFQSMTEFFFRHLGVKG